jgi:hypothetical protein
MRAEINATMDTIQSTDVLDQDTDKNEVVSLTESSSDFDGDEVSEDESEDESEEDQSDIGDFGADDDSDDVEYNYS